MPGFGHVECGHCTMRTQEGCTIVRDPIVDDKVCIEFVYKESK